MYLHRYIMFLVMDPKLFKNPVEVGHRIGDGSACQVLLIRHLVEYLMHSCVNRLHKLLSNPTLLPLKTEPEMGTLTPSLKTRRCTISIVMAGIFLPSGQQFVATISSPNPNLRSTGRPKQKPYHRLCAPQQSPALESLVSKAS
jgi:hypothetical protein